MIEKGAEYRSFTSLAKTSTVKCSFTLTADGDVKATETGGMAALATAEAGVEGILVVA